MFVAHGHSRIALAEVESFLVKARCDPIILKDRSTPSAILIDELVKTAVRLSFAVVIMTANDLGRAKNEPERNTMARARQNVIFEFGYLVALLKKCKVLVLHEEAVDVPSDLAGVIYIPYDERGAWERKLAGAVKKAAIPLYTAFSNV